MRLESKIVVDDLREAWDWSNQQMEGYRNDRAMSIQEMVGPEYGGNGGCLPTPVNMLAQAVTVLTPFLSGGELKGMCVARNPENETFAAWMNLAMEQVVKRIRVAKAHNAAIMDSLSGIGIVWKGINHGRQYGDLSARTNDLCISAIDLEDFVIDQAAHNWDDIQYVGHYFQRPLSVVKADQAYRKEARDKMVASTRADRKRRGRERTGLFEQENVKRFEEVVELVYVWLPQHGLEAVLDGSDFGNVLYASEYDGPSHGPYSYLGYIDVPGKLLPLPPMTLWRELHKGGNELFTKAMDGALSQKDILAVLPDGKNDAEKIETAHNLSILTMLRPDSMKQLKFGGADPGTLLMGGNIRELFNSLTQVQALGGLGPMSSTATQDQMIAASAARFPMHMRGKVIEFSDEIFTDLYWYLWHKQNEPMPLTMRDRHAVARMNLTRDLRDGTFFDYHYQVEPYTQPNRTPQERLDTVISILTNLFIPFGIPVNPDKLAAIVRQYTDLPELEAIMDKHGFPPGGPEGMQGQRSSKPPTTTRRYVRENVSAPKQGAGQDQLMDMVAGAQAQPTA